MELARAEWSDGRQRLGINLPPIFSWSLTPVYVDLLDRARRFGTPETPWDEQAVLGEDGWPVGDFGVFLTTKQRGASHTPGTYLIRFRGQASVRLVASRASLGEPRYDAAEHVTTVPLHVPEDGDQLALAFTGTGSGIKDLRVVRPGYDASAPPRFTREFLAHIAPFHIVRLMDWLRTNNNPVRRWDQRATPKTTHYASPKGVPWEHVVELARETGKDLWINVPANADDEYVRNLARLLREGLPQGTRVYAEYSNEVWNSQFAQFAENRAAAAEEVRTDPRSRLNFDGVDDENRWAYRRIAQRGKEISDLFREEFGDAAMMTRVRPVLATQVVNPYLTGIALDYIDAVFGPPSRYFYGLAGAPYFNLGARQTEEGLDTDQVLAAMSASIDALVGVNRFEENLALALWYRLPFLAYEGGSDTFGPGSLAAKKAASLDPRMEGLCRRYLDGWYGHGGGLFMWFHAGAGHWDTPYGTWELTTDLAREDTPKLRCLRASIEAGAPPLRHRHGIPGRIDALAYAGSFPPYGRGATDRVRHLRPGRHVDYLVLAPASGRYRLTLHAEAGRAGNSLAVATAAGSSAEILELPATGWDAPADSEPLEIELHAGFNVVRLTTRSATSGFRLHHLDVTEPPGRHAP